VFGWGKYGAESVRIYYGHYQISRVSIRVSPFAGKGIRDGMTFGGDEGGRITIRVGTETSATEFASDRTLTHEMVHLAFPSVEETTIGSRKGLLHTLSHLVSRSEEHTS